MVVVGGGRQTLRQVVAQVSLSFYDHVNYVPCEQCGKQFTQQTHLKTHIHSVHEKVNYPCNQCQYKAGAKGDLKKHNQSVHEKSGILVIYVRNNLHYNII